MYPRILSAVTLAVGSLGIATMANAARVDVEIGVAPPEAAVTTVPVVPQVREGFVYEPAHYGWDGQRYVWVDGEYIPNREGHHWEHYSLERHGDRWHYRSGHWDDD